MSARSRTAGRQILSGPPGRSCASGGPDRIRLAPNDGASHLSGPSLRSNYYFLRASLSTLLAMTSRWISEVPSTISNSLASRYRRSTPYSSQ